MGFFDRFRRENRTDEGTVTFEEGLLEALLGKTNITKDVALQIPSISGGIDLIANIIAGTPIKLFRDEGGKAIEVKDDYRIPLLNDETGDTLNANEFWRAMIRDYYVGKGGYAYINKSRGKIKSLHYVEEEKISILKNADPIFKDYSIQVNGGSYRPFDFLKIIRNTRDGAQGIPITQENSQLIAVAYQKMLLEYAMAKRGGNKKGFLKAERRLDQPSMDKLKADWANLYVNDNENAIVLNNGIDFKEVSDTSAEMQLDENKRTNAAEFAKLFHVSTEAMAGKAEDMSALAKLAAIPLMQVIQCALNRDLLLEKEKATCYFAFDTKELLKGDMRERFEAYKVALDGNFMQIDEVRYEEDLEPLGLHWIKLGLNDVLYDPKTGEVYTPNTNQTGGLSEPNPQPAADNLLQDEPVDDTIEPRADNDYIQDPSTGKMNGSRPSGDKTENGAGSGTDGSKGEKDLQKQNVKSLKKGMKSLEEKILLHEHYLKDPRSHVKEWDTYSQRRKDLTIKHWEREIRDFKVSIENRKIELKKRGENE